MRIVEDVPGYVPWMPDAPPLPAPAGLFDVEGLGITPGALKQPDGQVVPLAVKRGGA